MTMVEKYTQDYIQSILSDAQSIRDVTVDHIEELKHLQAGRLVLDKYQVSVEDFENWDAKDDQSGIEYDSRLQRVLVKSVDGASLYEYPNKCLYSWMEDLSSQLCISSRRGPYKNVGRTAYDLSGPYVNDRKESDQAAAVLDHGYPVFVIETGFCEDTEKLFENARKWLGGSEEKVRGVIVLDIKNLQNPISQTQYSESGGELTWGMSDEELVNSCFPHDDGELVKQVTKWYEKNGCKLFERAVATIYICHKDVEPVRYWACEFTAETAKSEVYAPDALFTLEDLLQGNLLDSNIPPRLADQKIQLCLERLTEHLKDGLRNQEKDHARLLIDFKLEELDRNALSDRMNGGHSS